VNPDPYCGFYRWKLATPDFLQMIPFEPQAEAGIREIWELLSRYAAPGSSRCSKRNSFRS
jgi:hypothetical protein